MDWFEFTSRNIILHPGRGEVEYEGYMLTLSDWNDSKRFYYESHNAHIDDLESNPYWVTTKEEDDWFNSRGLVN